jgi:hypothetical protein
MARLHLSLTVVGLAAILTCATALAESTAPAPKAASTDRVSSEPSTLTDVENWTRRKWNAAKRKLSQDKVRWNACNQDVKDQKLAGRKSWSYLYDCMTKS